MIIKPYTPTGGGGGLPAGVTLQQIDGGPTYFADNGFTQAVNMGMDNASYFPIGPWYSTYNDSVVPNTYSTWADIGWNFCFYADSIDHAQALSRGVAYMDTNGGSAITASQGSDSVMLMPQDEPANWGEYHNPIANTANSTQNTRPWYVNFTWNWMVYGNTWEGVYTGAPVSNPKDIMSYLHTTPNSTQRRNNIVSADVYWFTAARQPAWPYMLGDSGGGMIYEQPNGNMTAAQMQRGCNYGDMIDIQRAYQSANPAPIYVYLEDADPWEGGGTDVSIYIHPKEFHWAIWSTIIHGARGVVIFDHCWGGTGASNRCMVENPSNFYKTPYPGESISIYAQMKYDQNFIHAMARVINSPFAINFVTATPLGYLFPTPGNGFTAGGYARPKLDAAACVELCAHYYTGGSYTNSYGTFNNGLYIFAAMRGPNTSTNTSVTFTIAATGDTQVTVIGESRTIPLTNGGTQFVDTFADAYTVHIYKIGS
jgi:hypothetical protein